VGSPTFVDPYPFWSLGYGNLSANDKAVVCDFNGDGYDDIAIYRIGVTQSWTVRRVRPGEIRSSLTNQLPKKSSGMKSSLPVSYQLGQNYPNPFNPATSFQYTLRDNVAVLLKVYDVLGREIKTLVEQVESAGTHAVNFDASSLSSGVYFYRLQAGSFVAVKKMLLMR